MGKMIMVVALALTLGMFSFGCKEKPADEKAPGGEGSDTQQKEGGDEKAEDTEAEDKDTK